MKKNNKKIENFIRDFFGKMGEDFGLRMDSSTDKILSVKLEIKEPQSFIGTKGENLIAIQRLLNKIIKKNFDEDLRLDLDINDYKKRHRDYLKEMADYLAEEVVLSKRDKVLSPMLPYERRIIHMRLALRSDVKTESIGQGENRRVVIKLVRKD